jgi:hypothetical protein
MLGEENYSIGMESGDDVDALFSNSKYGLNRLILET